MGHLVQIAGFYDAEEAFCARGYLAARGIDTFIQNEHLLNVAPWLSVALGGYRLLGLSENKEAAARTLKHVSEIRIDEVAAGAMTADEAESAHEREDKNWWWLPIAFFSETPFLPSKKPGWVAPFQFSVMVLINGTLIGLMTLWVLHFFTD